MTDPLFRILCSLAPWLGLMLVIAIILLWLERKGQHFPHQYSTGSCHQTTSCESCNGRRVNCAIFGEGK